MSLETWKAQYYPVDAADVPPAEAVAHSLRKWEGLRKENLNKHQCFINGDLGVIDLDTEEVLHIDTGSCALCAHYEYPRRCPNCPLFNVLGGVRCDGANQPYQWFSAVMIRRNTPDPEPMISALKLAADWERQQAQAHLQPPSLGTGEAGDPQ